MKPFRYRELPQLPRLAWLAVMNRDAGDVLIYHGSALECRDHWMVEGTWDGEFALGGFHESEHFFGSGIRAVGDAVHFVPSSALVNGVYCCERRRELLVSNSLILLLAFTGARLDPDHDYRVETYAIRHGAERYARDFTVVHREIKAFYQVYDLSLVAKGPADVPLEFASARPAPAVPTYARYRELVDRALLRLRANYTSADRRAPLGAFATISSGYDSAAVAALVKDLGVEAYFTCRRSNTHIPRWLSRRAAIDDGTPIARALGGLTTIELDTRGSRVTDDELYFLAPGCAPPSLALHGLARGPVHRVSGRRGVGPQPLGASLSGRGDHPRGYDGPDAVGDPAEERLRQRPGAGAVRAPGAGPRGIERVHRDGAVAPRHARL